MCQLPVKSICKLLIVNYTLYTKNCSRPTTNCLHFGHDLLLQSSKRLFIFPLKSSEKRRGNSGPGGETGVWR
jgi:hypothetical protein